MMNKRSFLVGAAGALVASQAPAFARASAPLSSSLTLSPTSSLTLSPTAALGEAPGLREWQAYVQQRFALVGGGSLRLGHIELRDACHSGGSACEQFVLGFDNPGGRPVTAGIHTLRHANGQRASIYLEPTTRGEQQTLRAVFNLLPRAT